MKALLFDFFGTLVSYRNSRTEQGYHGSHQWVQDHGGKVSYEEFLALWVEVSASLDRRSDADDSEFSMTEAGTQFLTRLLGRVPRDEQVGEFVDRYVAEWSTGVTYVEGVAAMLGELSATHRLAVVSNTHSPTLVPGQLARMGVAELFDTVVLSVDLGWRKPHPAVYRAALERMGIRATDAIFVGDTYIADYVGPRAAGMRALLIDPGGLADIPGEDRLHTIMDLTERVRDHRR